jgi:hypothetical protein
MRYAHIIPLYTRGVNGLSSPDVNTFVTEGTDYRPPEAAVGCGVTGASGVWIRSASRGKLKLPPASSITFTWQM